jgi:hypothetical protein
MRFTCKVGSADVKFVFDTGSQESFLSDDVMDMGNGMTAVLLGQTGFLVRSIPASFLRKANPDGTVQGIIGVSALENAAIGIDYAKATATVWPMGASMEQERKWMSLATTDFKEIPLRISDRRVMLDANMGTHSVPMLVDTGSANNGYADHMQIPKDWSRIGSVFLYGYSMSGFKKFYIAPQFDIAGTQLSWKSFVKMGDMGIISPQMCWWPRVLLDFKNKRLLVPPDDRGFDIAMFLALALQHSLRIEDGKVFVSPGMTSVDLVDATAELLSVGKIDMEELASYQDDKAKLFELLCELFQETEHGCDLRIRNGDKIEVKRFKQQKKYVPPPIKHEG